MLYTINSDCLQLTVSSHGAELQSLKGSSGCEYLWQGDSAYWSDRAPVLFPVIGRLEGKAYLDGRQRCCMGIHGFAAQSEFSVASQSSSTLVLTLSDTPESYSCYPYRFTFELTYTLCGSTLAVKSRVTNRSDRSMPFAIGGHPGFRVPMEEGTAFEDYRLEFSVPCTPERVGFTPDSVLLDGTFTPYPLDGGDTLPLRHSLFDDDAIVLRHMARQVTLKSDRTARSIIVSYPQMPYLGIWHWPKTDAPYVCIEPWTSLPGRSGVAEQLSCRSDFIHLPAGESYENTWTVTVTEP